MRTQSQQQQSTGEQQLAAQRTRILELESMAHDAARELDSYKLQVDNMNKSKHSYTFGRRKLVFQKYLDLSNNIY